MKRDPARLAAKYNGILTVGRFNELKSGLGRLHARLEARSNTQLNEEPGEVGAQSLVLLRAAPRGVVPLIGLVSSQRSRSIVA